MNYIIIVTDCDCIVSFYSFHGTEKDMLSVLKKKAEERRQRLFLFIGFFLFRLRGGR